MKYFSDKISELKQQELYRDLKNSDVIDGVNILRNGKKYTSFCSNDYLGLSQNKEVISAAKKALDQYGFGSGASRYITGNNSLHQKLENKLAKIKQTEDALFLGSGYLSGVGIIPAIVKNGDLIIADKLIHSSLLDGAKLSGAKMLRFAHNDLDHCQKLLSDHRKNYQKCLILSETVFSMDGDLGKIDELLKLAIENDALLLSDDAHGLGILEKPSISHPNHLQCGTLSKAAGGYGGYVCATKCIIDYLRNFVRPAIYSTALPSSILAGNLKALEIISSDKNLSQKAIDNAKLFCNLLNLPKPQNTIIALITGETAKTLSIAESINGSGLLVCAIRPPTVAKNKARIRITFSALHKKSDVEELANVVRNALKTTN